MNPESNVLLANPDEDTIAVLGYEDCMARAYPKYTRQQINKAGAALIGQNTDIFSLLDAEIVTNNWRASHRFPLNSVQVTLRARALRIDPFAVVPQRLKRLSSIISKLRLNPSMDLSRMQDIGGCRAILGTVAEVRDLVKKYDEGKSKNPTTRTVYERKRDYIVNPKADGYRSVHLIQKYRSPSNKHAAYNDLRVEIQIRTRLQHAWATAVETASIFTGQPLKAIKAHIGDERWRRFFALMGCAMAMKEDTEPVPGTPTNRDELIDELKKLSGDLNVSEVLTGLGTAIRALPAQNATDAKTFLLVLDSKAGTVAVHGYRDDQTAKADEDYLRLEKEVEARVGAQVVSVRVESLDALRSAYPNYYLDTTEFIKELRAFIR